MRRKNQEITDKNIIEEILLNSSVCRIAMVDDNLPYIVPLNYGYKNNVIYFHSASEGKKVELLKKNGKVCFEIEDKVEIIKDDKPCKWSTKYRSVIGYGEISFINDYEEKKKALDIIMIHNGLTELKSYDENQVKSISILKLNITELTAKQSNH